MTNLVYYSDIYKGYNNGLGLINPIDQVIHKELITACNKDYLFVNSTWMEYDDNMINLLKHNPKKIVIYSGMDWHDIDFRKNVHDKLKEHCKDILYIGNAGGPGYFSFWLFFIEEHYENFYKDTPVQYNIDKLYMCLN